MLFKNTCFVIGAGANIPYPFPTGSELKAAILDCIEMVACLIEATKGRVNEYGNCDVTDENIKLIWKHCLDKSGMDGKISAFADFEITHIEILRQYCWKEKIYEPKFFRKLRLRFINSGNPSIDSFLQSDLIGAKEKDFLTKCIVAIIWLAERKAFLQFQESHWLSELMGNVLLGNKDIAKDFLDTPPTFLTFNYDRMLEHRLFNFFATNFKDDDVDKAVKLINSKIIHIYGTIGDFQKNADGHEELDEILFKSTQIKTVREIDDSYKRKNIFDDDYVKIYFVGFGFDQANCKVLRHELGQPKAIARIKASNYSGSFYVGHYAQKYFYDYVTASMLGLEKIDNLGLISKYCHELIGSV